MTEAGQGETADAHRIESILAPQADDDHEVIIGGCRFPSNGNKGEDDAKPESDNNYIDQVQRDPPVAHIDAGNLGVIRTLWNFTDLWD